MFFSFLNTFTGRIICVQQFLLLFFCLALFRLIRKEAVRKEEDDFFLGNERFVFGVRILTEYYIHEIISLTVSPFFLLFFRQAEARAEFAERSVQKLQKEVDRLEGKFSEDLSSSAAPTTTFLNSYLFPPFLIFS